MGHDVMQDVGVAFDGEVEAPIAANPGLPEIAGFVVFLGAQRGVSQIVEKEFYLLGKCPLDIVRCFRVKAQEVRRARQFHVRGRLDCLARSFALSFLRSAVNSSAVSKGPTLRPARASLRLLAI